MIFSDFYKNPRSPLSKLRPSPSQLPDQLPTATPSWVSEEYADLLSRDKTKQKEAIKRYLDANVKNDWDFVWPPVSLDTVIKNGTGEVAVPGPPVQDETREDEGYQVDDSSDEESEASDDEDKEDIESDSQSVYSVVSEDTTHWKPRLEWTSDLSDDDVDGSAAEPETLGSLDSSAQQVPASVIARRDRHRRELREEMTWNEGLACFEARRNAWTGAKIARVRAKSPVSPPTSPRSARRFFFRRSMSTSPPSSATYSQPTSADGSGGTSDTSSFAKDPEKDLGKHMSKDSAPSVRTPDKLCPVETLLPVPQPLLPPNSPFRATITPSIYLSLYDKVILQNLQPSCPINLSDMIRSCVTGWKRDGEWPPRPTMPVVDPMFARRQKRASVVSNDNNSTSNATKTARRMSLGLLGRDKDDESRTGKGIRRSLQRALGIHAQVGADEATYAL